MPKQDASSVLKKYFPNPFTSSLYAPKLHGMETKTAIELAGSATALAQILGVTISAVSQWSDELPAGRYYQLRVLRPKWFNKAGEPLKPNHVAESK
jgi:hypothetical protein